MFKALRRSLKARQQRGRVSSTDVETEVYDVMKDDKEKGGQLNTKAAWRRARGKLASFIYTLYSQFCLRTIEQRLSFGY